MKARCPLSFKIGSFAALLVVGACIAVWYWAVFRPAIQEREERIEQYRQIVVTLGLGGAVNATALTHSAMHPDLAFVLRVRNGIPLLEESAVHLERLSLVDSELAAKWEKEPRKALEILRRLDTNYDQKLVVKRLKLRVGENQEEIQFGFSTVHLEKVLRSRLISSALVLLGCLTIAVLGALTLARRIVRPVHELARAMDSIGKGEFPMVEVLSNDEVGLLARAYNEMVRGLKEGERLKDTLSRYVSDEVANRILSERSDLDLKGEIREVTVLFVDIRNFGNLAAKMPAREVMLLLNEYFEIVVEVIFKHHGTVNKFVGDAVMAVFGAPFSVDDAPMRAVLSAIEIEQRVVLVNQKRKAAGKPVVFLGIGINTGKAIAGNVGSERRMEYAVIGENVFLAQYLESLAGEGEILITHSTYQSVVRRVAAREREPFYIKSRDTPILVFEVTGLISTPLEKN